MCTVLLPPGVNPITVKKYININIKSGKFVLPLGNLDHVNKFLQLTGYNSVSCTYSTQKDLQRLLYNHQTNVSNSRFEQLSYFLMIDQ